MQQDIKILRSNRNSANPLKIVRLFRIVTCPGEIPGARIHPQWWDDGYHYEDDVRTYSMTNLPTGLSGRLDLAIDSLINALSVPKSKGLEFSFLPRAVVIITNYENLLGLRQ